jgi:ribosomal protein L36
MIIGVRDGGGRGGSCPPKKIRKSKSRANVQHKSGEKWEIKKRKREKVPSLLGKQRQSGNIRFTVGQYCLIIKRTGTNLVMCTSEKNFWTPKRVHCPKFFWRRGEGGGGGRRN